MAIRDRYDMQMPVLWGGTSGRFELSLEDQKIVSRCGYLRDDRNLELAFSTAFVGFSGMMAKAFLDQYPSIPDNHKDRYRFAAKAIAIAPLGIATLFFKWAYQDNEVYHQCLQDPRGTLARLAAEEQREDSKRVLLDVPKRVDTAAWLTGAIALVRTVAYYSAAVAEGTLATGLALCSPGLRYFSVNKRVDAI